MNDTEQSEPPSSSAASAPSDEAPDGGLGEDDSPGRQPGRHAAHQTTITLELTDRSGSLDGATLDALRTKVGSVLSHTGADGEDRDEEVDDAAIANAHAEYQGVEGTTDVSTYD